MGFGRVRANFGILKPIDANLITDYQKIIDTVT